MPVPCSQAPITAGGTCPTDCRSTVTVRRLPAASCKGSQAKRAVESKPAHRPPRYDPGPRGLPGRFRSPDPRSVPNVDAGRIAECRCRQSRLRLAAGPSADRVHLSTLAAQAESVGGRATTTRPRQHPRSGRVGADGGVPSPVGQWADGEDLVRNCATPEADDEHRGALPAARAATMLDRHVPSLRGNTAMSGKRRRAALAGVPVPSAAWAAGPEAPDETDARVPMTFRGSRTPSDPRCGWPPNSRQICAERSTPSTGGCSTPGVSE